MPTAFLALRNVGSRRRWVESDVKIVGPAIRAPLRAATFVAYYGAAESRENRMRGVEDKYRILPSGTVSVRKPARQFPC